MSSETRSTGEVGTEQSQIDAANGYKTIRSHNDIFHIAANGYDGFLDLRMIMALVKINAGCKKHIVKFPKKDFKDIFDSQQGRIIRDGKGNNDFIIETHKSKKTNLSEIEEYFGTETKMGYIPPPEEDEVHKSKARLGQFSRLVVAWWTDPEATRKTVRIFGDRIALTIPHPAIPSLVPFGINIYNIVYPESEAHPDHCSKCKKRIRTATEIRRGQMTDVELGYHVENPSQFFCESCKYRHDTGFLPGSLRKKKRK